MEELLLLQSRRYYFKSKLLNFTRKCDSNELTFQLQVWESGRKAGSLTVDYEPSSLAINPDNGDIAVGGSMDNKVRYLVTVIEMCKSYILGNTD